MVNMCVVILNRTDATTSWFKDDLALFNDCMNMLHNCDKLDVDLKATWHGFYSDCKIDDAKMKEMEEKIKSINKWGVGKGVAAAGGGVVLVAGAIVAAPLVAVGAAVGEGVAVTVGAAASIGGAIAGSAGAAVAGTAAGVALSGVAVAGAAAATVGGAVAGGAAAAGITGVGLAAVGGGFGLAEFAIGKQIEKVRKGRYDWTIADVLTIVSKLLKIFSGVEMEIDLDKVNGVLGSLISKMPNMPNLTLFGNDLTANLRDNKLN